MPSKQLSGILWTRSKTPIYSDPQTCPSRIEDCRRSDTSRSYIHTCMRIWSVTGTSERFKRCRICRGISRLVPARISTGARMPRLVTTSSRVGIVALGAKNVLRERSTEQRIVGTAEPFLTANSGMSSRLEGARREKQTNTVELFLPEFLAVSRISPRHSRALLPPPPPVSCFAHLTAF